MKSFTQFVTEAATPESPFHDTLKQHGWKLADTHHVSLQGEREGVGHLYTHGTHGTIWTKHLHSGSHEWAHSPTKAASAGWYGDYDKATKGKDNTSLEAHLNALAKTSHSKK